MKEPADRRQFHVSAAWEAGATHFVYYCRAALNVLLLCEPRRLENQRYTVTLKKSLLPAHGQSEPIDSHQPQSSET